MKRTLVLRSPEIRDRAISALAALNLQTKKPWCVEIKPYTQPRNLEQNALYWACVQQIARHVGHSSDDIHEIVKMKFLAPTVVELPDGDYSVVKSTTRLNKEEMSELIDQVCAWGASLGVEFDR